MEIKIKKNITIIHITIIIFVALLEVFLITKNKYIFGFGGDWLLQSTSFYEYFRNLFYETGKLFPDLALHIGGGQNIYYFAYYGLYSPYLFIFYFFPFIKAGDYLMITGILNMIISSIMLYIFLQKNSYNKSISLFGSLLLLTSTAMVFFNFTFIMFVQYIPFLILGLFGTKKYLDEKKSLLLVISIILIITTSYYFSVPSIICLCLYALYYYIKINNNIKFKIIFKDGIMYVLRILLGIIISCFLLFPIIYATLNGRLDSGANINLEQLLFGINIKNLMYVSNGLGLSSVVWFSMVYNILYLKREQKILSFVLLIIVGVPIFNLILNGFLYTNGKVLIPFIPLFIILILEMLNTIKDKKMKKILNFYTITLLLSIIFLRFDNFFYGVVFYIDCLITYIIIILYKKKNMIMYLIIFIIFIFTIYYVHNNNSVSLLSKKSYNDLYEIYDINDFEYINKDLSSLYRTDYNFNKIIVNYSDASSIYLSSVYSSVYNKTYKNIFYDIFNNNYRRTNFLIMDNQNNLFFERFMGIRYLITSKNVPYGYVELNKLDNITLYENKNVYSLGFSLDNLISYDDYNKLSFIEKLEAYQNNIIINDESYNSNLNFNYEKIDLGYEIKDIDNVEINYRDNHYIIDSEDNGKLIFSLNKQFKNKSLVIRFNVNIDLMCNNLMTNSFSIIINDIQNMTTCKNHNYYNENNTFDYVISSNDGIDELNIEISKGMYDISDIEVYAIDNSFFDKNNTTPLNIDFDRTKGDDIYGNIDVKKSGYFIFTIPYDKGFSAYVDGRKVEIEQVNGGFIGFKIDEGKHNIHLTFEAPYAKLGRFVSLIGIIIFIILNVYERRLYKKV